MPTIQRVGVVGSGLMGSGIAEVCARAGLDVVVREVDAGGRRSRSEPAGQVARPRRRQPASSPRPTATPRWPPCRSPPTSTISPTASSSSRRSIEDEDIKVDIFRQLDKVIIDEQAVLASNTSSIPIMKLGIATGRPEQVIGIHFFNPVPVLRLVELVTSLMTSPEPPSPPPTRSPPTTLNKQVIRSQDRAGFVVNALLIPYLLSAIRMMESGFATADDIDTGMVEGCNHPMGPLHLTDLIGLDTTLAVAESLYEEFKEPLYAPPPLLSRMVEAGLLGRKTGRGFYDYATMMRLDGEREAGSSSPRSASTATTAASRSSPGSCATPASR